MNSNNIGQIIYIGGNYQEITGYKRQDLYYRNVNKLLVKE